MPKEIRHSGDALELVRTFDAKLEFISRALYGNFSFEML